MGRDLVAQARERGEKLLAAARSKTKVKPAEALAEARKLAAAIPGALAYEKINEARVLAGKAIDRAKAGLEHAKGHGDVARALADFAWWDEIRSAQSLSRSDLRSIANLGKS